MNSPMSPEIGREEGQMKLMSLQQFIQQAREPQEPAYQEVLTMDVRHFLDAITTNYEDDSIAEVILNSPDPDSISVKFFVQAEETDEPEQKESVG